MHQYKALPFLPQLHFFSVKCGMTPSSIGQQAAWPDSQSSGPGFESRSYHWLDLFHGAPRVQILSHTYKYQNSLRRPVGIPNIVMFNLNYLFQLFARPH